ncbi:hypothetical protein DL769_011323 [Monosporascus sp. CRB-8-3]|nr:hypothetical protein DL769_011323 [Monosporascus sp. CRB-8-3]
MPNKRRRYSRLLSSDDSDNQGDSSDTEWTDDVGVAPEAKRTRITSLKTRAQSLLVTDTELVAEIKELASKIRHGDHDLVEACRWLHALEAKIEAHEDRLEQFIDDHPAASGNFGFLPPGTHRKSCKDVTLEIMAARLGILEKVQKETVATRESAFTGIESLKKDIEAVKASQISVESIKKVIKETPSIQATKQLQAIQDCMAATSRVSEPTRCISSHTETESKRIYAWNFAEHLKKLDFRAPHGIWGWSNVSLQFQVYHLWGGDRLKYVMRDQGVTPLCAERHERGHLRDHSDKDSLKSLSVRSYTQSVMELEICEPSQVPTSLVLPKYVTFLGNLFGAFSGSEGGDPSYQTSANNRCLVMDVTRPSKSVWLVYKYEYREGDSILEYGFRQGKEIFPTVEKEFDLALVCEDIRDWEEPNDNYELPHFNKDKVEDALRRTACRVKPVFTKPNLDDLLVAIEEGWTGHGDDRNSAKVE